MSAGKAFFFAIREQPITPNLIFFIRKLLCWRDIRRVSVVTLSHAQILMDDRRFAVVPFFRQKGDKIKIGDGICDVRDSLRDVYAVALASIKKLLLAFIRFCHNYRIAVGEKVVFIKLWVVVVAADFALVNELKVELDDRPSGIESENTAAAVADSVKIARRVQFPYFHAILRNYAILQDRVG
mgnify:CR=1 FL=1